MSSTKGEFPPDATLNGAGLARRQELARMWHDGRAVLAASAMQRTVAGKRALALISAAALFEGTGILLLVPILGLIVAQGGESQPGRIVGIFRSAGLLSPVAQLAVLIAVFLTIVLVRAVIVFQRDRTLADLQGAFIESRRNEVLGVLAAAPWSRVVQISSARVNSLLSLEIDRVGRSLQLLVRTGVTLLMMAAQICVAFWLAPGLTLCVLALFATGAMMAGFVHERVRRLGDRHVSANRAMMASSSSLLAGLKTATAQNAQAHFLDEYHAVQIEARRSMSRFDLVQAKTRLFFAAGSGFFAAALIFGGFAVFELSGAALVTIVLICARMSSGAMQLFLSTQQLVFVLPGFGTLATFLAELRRDVPDRTDTRSVVFEGTIELLAVSYPYPGGGGIAEATLTIEPGSFVGVTGPSGAGKTTLIDLIVGLIEPKSGSIRIDGTTLGRHNRSDWAAGIAYVSQDGFLFNDTVRRNLTWSRPAASETEIAEILELVGVADLVSGLPQGIDTPIGERGALLSGGERQRLALARALLCRPRLLVLDEAMNAIDAVGEAALLDRLSAVRPQPTILMVSHRDASLAWCNQILHVEHGRVEMPIVKWQVERS